MTDLVICVNKNDVLYNHCTVRCSVCIRPRVLYNKRCGGIYVSASNNRRTAVD